MMVLRLVFTLAFLCFTSSAFAVIEFNVGNLSQSSFEKAIDVEDTKKSTESLRALYEKHIKITPNSIVTRVKTIWYFPDFNDIQDLAQGRVSFNESTQVLKVLNAATILPSGKLYRLKRADTKEIDENSYNIFSSWKEVLFNFPKLVEGGFTYLEYEVATDRNKMELDWSTTQFPQIYQKTGQYILSIEWQGVDKPNFYAHSKSVNCTEKKTSILCLGSDIPAAISDENVYAYDELDYIEAGELKSWQQVIDLSLSMFSSSYVKNPEYFKHFLLEHLGNDFTKQDAVAFLHQFISRDIQYLSQSEHGHSVIPHSTTATLDKMIGDCKDKTALFIDLAKQVGIDAYPVLVSTERQNSKRSLVPSLRKFNHVVACYTLAETEYCSDLTDTYTPWQEVSSWIQGKFALRLLADSQPQQLRADEYKWRYKVKTEVEFLENGGQTESQTRVYENLYSAWYKGILSGKNKDELQRWLVESYNTVVADKVTPEISITGLSKMQDQLVIQSKTEYEPFLDTQGVLAYMENDSWLLNELKNNYPVNQSYGEYTSGFYLTSEFDYKIPEGWIFTIKPASVDLQHKFGSLTRTSNFKSLRQVHVQTTLKLPHLYLAKDDLTSYKLFLDALKGQLPINLSGIISE